MAIGRYVTSRKRRLVPGLVPVLAALMLSACVQGGQPELSSRQRSVALEDAFVAPPVGGPQILDVVQQRYPNATEQRILLANRSAVPGENYLQVQFFGPVGNSGTGRTPLDNRSIAATNMTREIRQAVPTVPMSRSQIYVQNRYGPFGYAVGRAASGDTCIYAWQRIAGVDTSTLLLRDRGTIQIRFRLCDQEASEERLLFSMYGFTIRAFFSNLQWNPYGAPKEADARLGALGEPMLPEGAGGFEGILADAPDQPAPPPPRPAAARPAAPAVAPAPPPLPAPVGPIVPPPPGSAAASTVPAREATVPPAADVVVPPPPSANCTPAQREAGAC
ncbi:cellulose biosynthesis protein BcsN [Aureimonas populi]|uniref:Cellulose biosynthesis protein BcsN n=1 Tax=Aureimonas populi TaxID=1701758 RepID=A0ABW5CIM0_9HYPH|nr:cellulose biosynthesis protein BcsN [Aureimonas populi]